MVQCSIYSVFRKGSRTFFYSSLFFPKDRKEKIFVLYAFVRMADDLVDSTPQDIQGFNRLKQLYRDALNGKISGDTVIDLFAALVKEKGIDGKWVESFFEAMEMDLTKKKYLNEDELDKYVYGAAQVIGLMMTKILELPDAAIKNALALGRSMQLINMIRDINVDLTMGRIYLPLNEMNKFGLSSLEYDHIKGRRAEFTAFINDQISKYLSYVKEAEEGYKYIPYRYLIPVKTAADMYKWTAAEILKDPLGIYKQVIKPPAWRIILNVIKNVFVVLFLKRKP